MVVRETLKLAAKLPLLNLLQYIPFTRPDKNVLQCIVPVTVKEKPGLDRGKEIKVTMDSSLFVPTTRSIHQAGHTYDKSSFEISSSFAASANPGRHTEYSFSSTVVTPAAGSSDLDQDGRLSNHP